MKYSSLSGGIGNGSARWRFKSTTVKACLICLFFFSFIFISYQLIYYVNLTEYQSEETQSRQVVELTHNEIPGSGSFKSTPKYSHIPGPGDNKGDVHPHSHKVGGSERKKGKPVLSMRIVGVRPSDLHLYQDQQQNNRELFQCFTTHKQISWEKVNDDFCDCPLDGSDEPSTAACMSGKFYCLKRDGTRDFIPSSRVNDGVCDCLDGTDEHDGFTKCRKVQV